MILNLKQVLNTEQLRQPQIMKERLIKKRFATDGRHAKVEFTKIEDEEILLSIQFILTLMETGLTYQPV